MKHLAENTIQAFLDGELSDELMATATAHLAQCERCTDALLAAEAVIAEINLAFAQENALPCPTQRIWARIENEIDVCAWHSKAGKSVENSAEKSVWARLGAFISPAQVAFAGGLAAVVLVSLVSLSFFEKQLAEPRTDLALDAPSAEQNLTAVSIPETAPQNQPRATTVYPTAIVKTETSAKFERASFQAAPFKNASLKLKIQNPKSSESPLAEEKDYLNSIAALSNSVASVDQTMRPSFRVEYERSLAMVDQAITQMQKQARRNPRDESAKRLLFASYQNKIELLTQVSEKTQLVASMQ